MRLLKKIMFIVVGMVASFVILGLAIALVVVLAGIDVIVLNSLLEMLSR